MKQPREGAAIVKRTRKAGKSVPRHEQNGNGNGSRSFLADEVHSQREELTKLGKEVANNGAWLTQLIEAEKRAREYRDGMKEEVSAVRSEQAQIMQSIVALQSSSEKIAKTLAEHETERQQGKGAWNLASASAKTVGGIIIGVIVAISGFALMIYKVVSSLPGFFKSSGAP